MLSLLDAPHPQGLYSTHYKAHTLLSKAVLACDTSTSALLAVGGHQTVARMVHTAISNMSSCAKAYRRIYIHIYALSARRCLSGG